jgi:glycosyltransferase involved in cell wall biosynthesis
MVTTISRFLRDFLLPHAQYFRAQGWHVDALTHETAVYPECADCFTALSEITWSRNPLDPRNLLRAPGLVREFVERGGYDVVHVHTPVAAFVTRYALRDRLQSVAPRVIYTAHGFHFHPDGDPVRNRLFLQLERMAGPWTDYLVVMNSTDYAAALQHRLVTEDQLYYIPGIGVDLTRYTPSTVSEAEVARVREELGMSDDAPLFVMVAEFNPDKRHQDALQAFARLGCPEAHIAFAGEGKLVQPMRQLARTLGVASRVHFLGFRTDIPALMKSATATILPSVREGLPRAVMESLGMGVPVIGADGRGIHDLLKPECGILVPPRNAAHLSQAMTWMLEHPQERRLLGQNGRKRMVRYALHTVLAQHEALYARALGRPDTQRRAA